MPFHVIWSSRLYLARSKLLIVDPFPVSCHFCPDISHLVLKIQWVSDFALSCTTKQRTKSEKVYLSRSTRLRMDDQGIGIWFQRRAGDYFLALKYRVCLWGPPSRLCSRFFPRVTRSGPEADHPSPCGTDVKDAWRFSSFLPYLFKAWCPLPAYYTLWGTDWLHGAEVFLRI